MAIFIIYNGVRPTTAKRIAVATGTSIKTLLQVKASTTIGFIIKEWGISFDGSVAAEPISVELLETGTIFATVTAHVTSGIERADARALQGGDPVTNLIPVGTTATGFTASGEGTIVASRSFDVQLVAPTNQYVKQFPLGEEPFINIASAMRIRVHAGANVNAICYVKIEV